MRARLARMRTRDRSGNRAGERRRKRLGSRRGNPPRSRARLGIGAGVLAALLPLARLSFPTDLSGQTVRGVLSAAPICLGAVAISPSAQEPPAPIELSGVGCADCAVRFEQVVRLGDEYGPGRITRTDVVVQRGDGKFVLHVGFDPGFLYVFGADGTYLGKLGREGSGPGEFRTIQELISVGSDGLIAFDSQNQRATLLDREGGAHASIPLRGVLPAQTGVVAFPGDSLLVVNRRIQTESRAGRLLHVVDFQGGVRASFGTGPDGAAPLDENAFRRKLAGSLRNTVWAASAREYRVDEWSLDGARLKSYVRQPDWFVPEDPYVPISPEGGRFSEVMDIDLDPGTGYLWVLVQVPSTDPDWTDGLISEEYGGRVEYGPGDYSKLYDTMIEVIDVTNDRLVASQRVGPALRRFVGTRLASSFSTDDSTGVESLDLWRMSVIEEPRGGPEG